MIQVSIRYDGPGKYSAMLFGLLLEHIIFFCLVPFPQGRKSELLEPNALSLSLSLFKTTFVRDCDLV